MTVRTLCTLYADRFSTFTCVAVGETTPGASVQKATPAASRQDIFAGKGQLSVQIHVGCIECRENLSNLLHKISGNFFLLSEQLGAIPEFSKLGPLFKSADKPVELTESETEYVVRCIKHTFANHIVFQVRSDWSDVVTGWQLQGPLRKVEGCFTQLSLIYPAKEIVSSYCTPLLNK